MTDDRQHTTDDGRQTQSDGKSSHCLWQGEFKKIWKIQNVLTKSSEGPAKTCIKVVPVGPESTGSQADGREWDVGAFTPILWYTIPSSSTAHTFLVPHDKWIK
jgi:hypothetical protein